MQIRTGRRFCLCLAAAIPAPKETAGYITQPAKRNNNHITRPNFTRQGEVPCRSPEGEFRICR
jgi:hypothetical protein